MSMGRSYDMNEHVLFDILLCLPVMSLLRFKAVCKDWFSLIESSSFISKHLNYHRDSKDDNLIISYRSHNEPKLALLSGSKYEECDFDIENGPLWHPARAVWQIGHCDGIVCFAHQDEIALWNPALKQLRPLPPSLFSSPKYKIHTALGIDIKGNDYKVVRIGLEYRNSIEEMVGNRVEVFDLTGDNSWRIIHKDDVLPFCGIITLSGISSSKSGICFWVAYRYDLGDRVLLSFDFSEDLFRVMSLPHIQNDVSGYCRRLDLLDDKVVCIMDRPNHDYYNMDFDEVNFEIWMLHEFGVEDSWNKMYKVGPMMLLDLIQPLGISQNGEFLICSKPDVTICEGEIVAVEIKFYLYNLHTQQGIFHQNCNLEPRLAQLIHYNASLISLQSVNCVVRPT